MSTTQAGGGVILYAGSSGSASPSPGSPSSGYQTQSPRSSHSQPSSPEPVSFPEIGPLKRERGENRGGPSPKLVFQFPEANATATTTSSGNTYAHPMVAKRPCSFTGTFTTVRFGRIPKREKQRLLDEMQSYMNSLNESASMEIDSSPSSSEAPASPESGDSISSAYHNIFTQEDVKPVIKMAVNNNNNNVRNNPAHESGYSHPAHQTHSHSNRSQGYQSHPTQSYQTPSRCPRNNNVDNAQYTYQPSSNQSQCPMSNGSQSAQTFQANHNSFPAGKSQNQTTCPWKLSGDRSGMADVAAVEQLQETLIKALRSLITHRRPDDSALFPKLLLRLPDLRTLNNLHSDKLLAFSIDL
ncbi:unnamed protein product [Coregonus sp. 'balchen']|nr:unnamed protein product [Coregonus sp. 'balchen']